MRQFFIFISVMSITFLNGATYALSSPDRISIISEKTLQFEGMGFDYNDFESPFGQIDSLVNPVFADLPVDTLEAIISQIEADSIQSYDLMLESFLYRVVGSDANAQARNWIVSKLEDFGYTPVLDTCSYGSNYVHNIMAYKEGASFSNKYIIIGAHYDVVPGSPGAGDDGAGVAGVMEIARILRNRDTHYTFIFSLFDGEEVAVVGSSYMADRLKSNNDSVLAMLNMDEISWNDFTGSTVRLFYGPGQYWLAQLYGNLAQSLPSISLYPSYQGSSYYSDHYPFQSCGYNVLFALNYPPAPYRHTNRDSSTYVNFSYAARIIRGVAATAVELDYRYRPSLGLAFEYPDGLPLMTSAKAGCSFNVRISGLAGGVPAPGNAMLYYSVDGVTFSSISLTGGEDGLYMASIPPLSCNNDFVYFYVSGEEVGGETFYDPDPSNPNIIPIVTDRVTVFTDDFEEFRGWNYEALWSIGSPAGMGGEFGSPDPVGGRNSAKCLAYNIYGDYEHNLPERFAVSPAIDCSGLSNVHLKFWRWLGIQFLGYDFARIAVSTDGENYSYVWSNVQQTAGGYWMADEVDISAMADNQSTVYIIFILGPTNGSWRYCGWNIDDLEVYGYKCAIWICGDVNDDTKINLLDVSYIIASLYRGGPKPDPIQSADVNGDGKMNLLDVSYIINFLYRHGPVPNCG
jgi:hypothetical protein